MPCVKPDGTLEPLAQAILRALHHPRTVDEVCAYLRLPIYRVRSTIRELMEAGLVVETAGSYALTATGETKTKS